MRSQVLKRDIVTNGRKIMKWLEEIYRDVAEGKQLQAGAGAKGEQKWVDSDTGPNLKSKPECWRTIDPPAKHIDMEAFIRTNFNVMFIDSAGGVIPGKLKAIRTDDNNTWYEDMYGHSFTGCHVVTNEWQVVSYADHICLIGTSGLIFSIKKIDNNLVALNIVDLESGYTILAK